MSEGRTAANAAQRVGAGAGRLVRAWRALPSERRPAVLASIGLFLTLFLPWYQETAFVPSGKGQLIHATASVTGWGAFSWVEAAVLLVAFGVLTLLFQRAEGRAFHLPGGDGGVIAAAGFWTCVLIVWRIFDKQGAGGSGKIGAASGIEWGIFIALVVAASLAWAGNRIRKAHAPEPPLPGDQAKGAQPVDLAPRPADPAARPADPAARPADPAARPADPESGRIDPEAPTLRSSGSRRAAAAARRSQEPTLPFDDPPPDQPTLDQLTIKFDDEP
jgi:hypothetical protein